MSQTVPVPGVPNIPRRVPPFYVYDRLNRWADERHPELRPIVEKFLAELSGHDEFRLGQKLIKSNSVDADIKRLIDAYMDEDTPFHWSMEFFAS